MAGRLTIAATSLTVLAAWGARLWAEWRLDYGEPVPLFGHLLRLTLADNAGVAFGLLGGSPLVPWLAAVAMALFALGFAHFLLESRAGGAALGLVLGGSVANLIDRLDDGRVTDYLDLGLGSRRWPTFNLPDTAIVLGLLLALWLLFERDAA